MSSDYKPKKANGSVHLKKKAMVLALESTLGIITAACNKVGIGRVTHYEWYNTDQEYRTQVDGIIDIALDFAESMLLANIKDRYETSIIFYLKTKGKARGYIERQEIDHDLTKLPKRFNLIVRNDDDEL